MKKFPTPRAFCHKDSKTDRGKCNLGEVVGGLLNPDWVEWLMGWPIFLASLEPMDKEKFDEWVTATTNGTWWANEPADVPRVAMGVKNRVPRLKAIGNGQVPACVARAWEFLTEEV